MLLVRAFIAGERGDFERGIAFSREAVTLAAHALGEHESETIMARRQLAQELLMAGQIEESVAAARAAHESALENFGTGGRNALLVETQDMYGRALADAGQLEEGIDHLRSAVAKAEALFGPNHSSVASKLTWLARAQMKLGDLNGAIESMQRSVELAPTDLDRARAAASLGVTLVAARRLGEAVSVLRKAVADLKRADTGEGSWLPSATATLGNALALSGQAAEAQHVLRANLEIEGIAGSALADTHNGLGFAALERDAHAALAHFQEALKNAGPADSPSRIRAAALLGLGLANLAAGRLDEAEQALTQADAAHAKLFGRMTPSQAEVMLARARIALVQERKDEAAKLIGAAHEFWQSHDPTSERARETARLHEQTLPTPPNI
jgi:tetratricopeptide (TPR) repeat protein